MPGKKSKSTARAARKPAHTKRSRRAQKDLGPRDASKVKGGTAVQPGFQLPNLPSGKLIIPCI